MNAHIGLNIFDNIDKLFFSLAIIVSATFLISQIMSKLGKPIVISGIIAGFILNNAHLPSTFFAPRTCDAVGSLGIVLFMMLVGSQLDYQMLIKRKVNILFSTFTLIIPFIVGCIVSIYLIHSNWVQISEIRYQVLFSLFFGLAISMTAFPLVSMYLSNNNLINRKVANVALFCASVGEVLFWVILGLILLYFQRNATFTNFRPIYIVFYLVFMFGVAPRIVNYIVSKIENMRSMLGFIMVGCLFAAALSDLVNLHQVFGGFIFGVLLPKDNKLVTEINGRIGDLVNSLLLPAYFVKTGMDANLSFIWDINTLYIAFCITIVAILSKFASAIVTGSLMGYNIRESVLLGSLLNMRGIFEIMLLNIGLDVGIINSQLYSVLIIMTLITTFGSTSLSPWLNRRIKRLD